VDLKFSIRRVKAALRNSPTQILRAEATKALAAEDQVALRKAGFRPAGRGFLQLPLDAARSALASLRDIWGGSGAE